MIEIIDNYASEDLYNQLLVENLYYGKVHWVGIRAEPENVLHDLIHEVYRSNVEQEDITGATAWYNIRPKNPKMHNDIDSYSTKKGISYRPEVLPERTFLYYLKSPESGGQLAIHTRASFVRASQDIIWDDSEVDTISAIVNPPKSKLPPNTGEVSSMTLEMPLVTASCDRTCQISFVAS